jgi:DNA (cytosine-5)-methyltransferase 1
MPVTVTTHRLKIERALDDALVRATVAPRRLLLPDDVRGWITSFNKQIDRQATSAFNNIITCLACAAADPTCDPRYHRQPNAEMPSPSTGRTYFTGRSISEQIVYPWLARQGFRGSMSGWQTRVFERNQPYTLKYRENIARVKIEFLSLLDAASSSRAKPTDVMAEFFRLEREHLEQREAISELLAKHPTASEISIGVVIEALTEHFQMEQSARLPVLAIQAIYKALLPSVKRFDGRRLAELSEHSAADVNTGAVGDVEIIDSDDNVFEAVEVKHRIEIDDNIIRRACEKIRQSTTSRYYVLSTAPKVAITGAGLEMIANLRQTHGCQIVVNGVLPSVRYYLRLLEQPADFLDAYQQYLVTDRTVTSAQKQKWLEILHDQLLTGCDINRQ